MGNRILIVEDDQDSCDLSAEVLRQAGYETIVAYDGMEALFRVKAGAPELVILDLGLPKLDGFYIAEVWRRDPEMKDVPIVAISAHLDKHNQERAISSGCMETLAKPFDGRQLVEVVERVLASSNRLTG